MWQHETWALVFHRVTRPLMDEFNLSTVDQSAVDPSELNGWGTAAQLKGRHRGTVVFSNWFGPSLPHADQKENEKWPNLQVVISGSELHDRCAANTPRNIFITPSTTTTKNKTRTKSKRCSFVERWIACLARFDFIDASTTVLQMEEKRRQRIKDDSVAFLLISRLAEVDIGNRTYGSRIVSSSLLLLLSLLLLMLLFSRGQKWKAHRAKPKDTRRRRRRRWHCRGTDRRIPSIPSPKIGAGRRSYATYGRLNGRDILLMDRIWNPKKKTKNKKKRRDQEENPFQPVESTRNPSEPFELDQVALKVWYHWKFINVALGTPTSKWMKCKHLCNRKTKKTCNLPDEHQVGTPAPLNPPWYSAKPVERVGSRRCHRRPKQKIKMNQ